MDISLLLKHVLRKPMLKEIAREFYKYTYVTLYTFGCSSAVSNRNVSN